MVLTLRGALWLALRSLRRRSALPLLMALLVPPASISVPLTMGASFQESLRADIYDKLGELDIIVRSSGRMRLEVFDTLSADPRVAEVTDGLAPALVLPAIVTGPGGSPMDSKVNLFGVDDRVLELGSLRSRHGERLPAIIPPGEILIGDGTARRVGAAVGDSVRIEFSDPAYSLESVYTTGSPSVGVEVVVGGITDGSGLGGLSLAPRGEARRNAFANLSWLMEESGREGINAVLV